MTEEKKMETTQSLACMDSSEFTFEQDQKLRMHFNKEPFPKEETMEALAEALKLTTRDIKVRFHRQSQRLHGAGGSSVPSLHPCAPIDPISPRGLELYGGPHLSY